MNILQIHWRYDGFGGAETYLHSLCASLEESGHRVSVISSRRLNENLNPDDKLDLLESSFGFVSGYRMLGEIEKIVAWKKPDVIHLHETLGFLSPLIVRRLAKTVPVVQTLHTAFFFVLSVPKSCLQGTCAAILWASPVGYRAVCGGPISALL